MQKRPSVFEAGERFLGGSPARKQGKESIARHLFHCETIIG